MTDERFSDKEVALVLRRAAEIDAAGPPPAGGMTVADIEAVATEAGIGADAVRRALAEIAVSEGEGGRTLIAPASRRTSLRVEGELSREQMERLVREIEDQAGRPGAVTEALGTVRWTASEGTWTAQVAVSTADGETRIAVHERVADSVRAMHHVLPSLWGGMLGIVLSASADMAALAILAVSAVSIGAGFGIGRAIFNWRSRRSGDRVDKLAQHLEGNVRQMVSAGEPKSPAPATSDSGR